MMTKALILQIMSHYANPCTVTPFIENNHKMLFRYLPLLLIRFLIYSFDQFYHIHSSNVLYEKKKKRSTLADCYSYLA